ncbi:MAG: hypothetical protein JWM10_4424 [Myxococcaceae bacterium]|nr:hypothetical protein [Myxococcaceae bacterium]
MQKVIALVLGAAVVGGASLGVAHSTGHEARTRAQCERLPTPNRQACITCVTRPARHHYHPDYPAAERCRADNGRP